MFGKELTIAEIEANCAGVRVGYAVYLQDPRKLAKNGTLTHGLRPAFRTANLCATTKKLARSQAERNGSKAYIVEQRWDSRGRAWVETVKFVATAKSCKAA